MSVHRGLIGKDLARDPSDFRPYPEFPCVSPSQLDGWMGAVKITTVSAIEWRWPLHWTVGPRVLTDSMYFWFERGAGTAWFGEPSNSYQFHDGDLLLIPQGVKHLIGGNAVQEPHVYAVHFHANLFGGVPLLGLLGFPLYLPGRRGAPYKYLSEQMVRDYATKSPGWSVAMANHVFSLLHYMIRNDTESFRPLLGIGSQSELPRLLPVLSWVEANLASPNLTIADLSRQVFLGETHFRRIFHKVFGMSPIQFIRQRRIERACNLLRTTDMPIKQVAQQCGFAEDAFFSRVFHLLVGTSPALYRKEVLL